MKNALQIAIEAAHCAGNIQRAGMGTPLVIRTETQHDIKLQTDVDCEEAIREILLTHYPDHAILGEEGGGEVLPDTPTWIVDPLDGTVNYARRIPHFCTSIALSYENRTLLGVIYDPLLDELYTAQQGTGAFLNDQPIAVSEVDNLGEAILTMGFSKSLETLTAMEVDLKALSRVVRKIRIYGAAALDFAYVAAGRFDGFIEYGLRSWDIAAGTLLVREAGGRVELTPAGKYTWDARVDNGKLHLGTPIS